MLASLPVFARICPKPEHFTKAKAAIEDIIPATRAEPGCFAFNLYEGANDGALYLYEEWRDEAALSAHHAMPYTAAVFEQYLEWLAADPTLIRLRRIA